MTLDHWIQFYAAKPFRPFVMHLADGRSVSIKSPEFIAAAPIGRTVMVYQPNGTLRVIDLLLVTELEVSPEDELPTKGRKKRG